ncbi:hypothetical protein ACQJ22_28355, partial [Pseudomonas fragariae (ex Marin et al. 2024)]
ILLNRGDAAYRQLTPDSLTHAKLWYTRAHQFLGTRPSITRLEPWSNITLAALASSGSSALTALEQQAPKIEITRPVEGATAAS